MKPRPAEAGRGVSLIAWGPATATVLLVAVVARLPTLAFPLTEVHSFRQTQTAFPAVIYATQGIDLFHPSVPIAGPPWSLPFEFPLFQAAGALLIDAGLSVETALRSLALLSFVGTALMLWALLRRNVNDRTAFIGLALFVASPFSILFSRAALVEYPATLGALVFVYAALEWHRTRQRRWLPIALLGGSFATLIKITTAVFWLLPALLTRRVAIIVVAAVAAGIGLAWTQYADAIKGANSYTLFLTSANLVDWNFGGDRLAPASWIAILGPVLVAAGLWLLPLALLVAFRPERLFWAWMGIAMVGPLLTFTNLYVVHDYYTAAVTPAIAAMIAGGLDYVMTRYRRIAPVLGAAAALVAVLVLRQSAPYWGAAYGPSDPEGVLAAAAVIDGETQADDVVATIDTSWSPAPFFYAHRRGYALQRSFGLQPPAGAVTVELP